MRRRCILGALLAASLGLVWSAVAQEHSVSVTTSTTSAATDSPSKPAERSSATHNSASAKTPAGATEASLRLEGEKRFRTNCGRCHQPPHKFAPRVMATAIRHMRVRAMITEEDMRLILLYMTE